MYRDQQWKLVNYHHKGICELYNLAQDPWEFQDLSTDPNWQDKKWALTQKSFDSTVSAQSPMTPRIQPYWLRRHFRSTISHKGCLPALCGNFYWDRPKDLSDKPRCPWNDPDIANLTYTAWLSGDILVRQLRLLTAPLLSQDSNCDKIQTNEQSSGLPKLFKGGSQHLSSGLNS